LSSFGSLDFGIHGDMRQNPDLAILDWSLSLFAVRIDKRS